MIYINERDSEVADSVHENNVGFEIQNEDVSGTVAAIRKLKNNPALRKDIAERARKTFEAQHNTHVIDELVSECSQRSLFH